MSKKDYARTFGQDLMRGEHTVGEGKRVGKRKPTAIPGGGGGGAWLGGPTTASTPKYRKTEPGLTWVGGNRSADELDEVSGKILAASQSGTSIFDPVLCELVYRWFCPLGGLVLDPFAGGSVRGIVAATLGRRYVGVDLRPEQVAANLAQAMKICDGAAAIPQWVVGDSQVVVPQLDVEADLIFSCPPYGDLEVYSDDPLDLSTMEHEAFVVAYRAIIAASVAKLKQDRFACFVVGDYRDGRGFYRDFVSTTISAFEAAGAGLYNEAILVTAVGSLPIRVQKQFSATRKLGKTHQNVLVFCKGDPRKATEAIGEVEFGDGPDDAFEEDPAEPMDDGPAAASDGRIPISVSVPQLRQMFTTCGPACNEANGCGGRCCDAPTHPDGCMVTVHPSEQAHIESLGAEVVGGFIKPKPGGGCPFKANGLCSIHTQGKPFGCIASPFTLNNNDTLIVRNRYRMLPCYKGDGPKEPAYIAFADSLVAIMGEGEYARLVRAMDDGRESFSARVDPSIAAMLRDNDAAKRKAAG